MRPIGEEYRQKLLNAGLEVFDPFSEKHSLAHGIWVGKPTSTIGNHVPDYRFTFGGTPSDAPAVMIIPKNGKWIVWIQEHIPTMGAGDFQNSWDTEQEAIDDVLDFYFGDPKRMQAVDDKFKK